MEEIMKSGSQYVYMYWIDGIPRYVGNGRGRRIKVHLKDSPNLELRKLISDAIVVQKKIIATGTQEEMDEKERELIQKYGRLVDGSGTLCNLLSGGKKGWNVDADTKKKISNSNIGREGAMTGKFNLSCPNTKQKYQQIHPITGEVIAEYFSNEIVKAGFNYAHCHSVANGKGNTHKGFSWKIISI